MRRDHWPPEPADRVTVPVALVGGDEQVREGALAIMQQRLLPAQRVGGGGDPAIEHPGAKDGRVVALIQPLDAKVEPMHLLVDGRKLGLFLLEQGARGGGGRADRARHPEQGDDRREYQTAATAGSHVTQTAVRPAPR
jgi:hypothetical protein